MRTLRAAAFSALLLSLPATPAVADTYVQNFWQEIQTSASIRGLAITAAEREEGGGLALSDLTIATVVPFTDDGSMLEVTVTLPEAYLHKGDDGRVALNLPRETPLGVKLANTTADWRSESSVTVKHDGSPIWISQDGKDLAWEFASNSLLLKLADLEVWSDGKHQNHTENLRFAYIKLRGFSYSGTTGSRAQAAADRIQSDGMTYNVTILDSENGSKETLQGGTKGFSAQVSSGPGEGYSVTVSAEGAFGSVSEITGRNMGRAGLSTATAELDFWAGSDRIDLETKITGAALEIVSPGTRRQYGGRIDEASFSLATPTVRRKAPEDFGLSFSLGGLMLNDNVWMQLDPDAWLPRDPAEFALRLAGKARVTDNVRDSELLKFEFNDEPLAVHFTELKAPELRLAAGGAALSGSADVVYQGSKDAPVPVGTAQLSVTGLHGFLDKLVKLGMLSSEDATPLRFMLAAFTKPGEGPDTLVTDFAFEPDGAVLANGQRIK